MHYPASAGILGVGMAVPERVVTNFDLEQMVDTTDEWIVSRTGIRERRICGPEETSSSLGTLAARRALEDAGVLAEEIDLVLCATATGDYLWPATACVIQNAIGATRAAAFDLSAACAGFVYGLAVATALVQTAAMRRVLLVGVDTLSKQLDWSDRSTCVLFGDGAGAVVVGPCPPGEGVLASALGADGSGVELIWLPAGGTKTPITPEAMAQNLHYLAMRGAEVYKFAVKIMGEVSLEALCRARLTPDDVDLFVPHQANIRIIQSAAERIGLPMERVFVNVDRYGNTSAASIPIALAELQQERRLRRGSTLVLVGFGAGLTWGANVVRWSKA